MTWHGWWSGNHGCLSVGSEAGMPVDGYLDYRYLGKVEAVDLDAARTKFLKLLDAETRWDK